MIVAVVEQLQINSKKFSRLQRNSKAMASALALQCSTHWAIKTHTLGTGQFVEFILTREKHET